MNIIDHISAVVRYVGRQHSTQRCDKALFPLTVPIRLNTGLNAFKGAASAQFACKTHLRPGGMDERFAHNLLCSGDFLRSAQYGWIIVCNVRFNVRQITPERYGEGFRTCVKLCVHFTVGYGNARLKQGGGYDRILDLIRGKFVRLDYIGKACLWHGLPRIKMKFIDSRLADWFAIVPDWEGVPCCGCALLGT